MYRTESGWRQLAGMFASLILLSAPVWAADTTPDAFSFAPVSDAPLASVQTSNAITVSGIDAAAPIAVTGGSYSINGGSFVTRSGSVRAGQSVRVRQTASSQPVTTTTATLTIGGVSGSFSVTTAPAPAVSIDDVRISEGNSGTQQARLTLRLSSPANQTVTVRFGTANGTAVAGSDYVTRTGTATFRPGETRTTQPFTINGDTVFEDDETFVVTLNSPVGVTIAKGRGVITIGNDDAPPDTTPDAFSFTPVGDVPMASVQTSNAITVSGINAAAPISVTGGSYSIDGGAFVTSAGAVRAGQSVRLRQTASSQPVTTTTATLTIGGVTGSFVVTTAPAPMVSIDDIRVSEGNSGTLQARLTLSLSSPASQTVTVRFGTANGTATAGSDYVTRTGVATFRPGETRTTQPFTINGDAVVEDDETFVVNLNSPMGVTIAKGQGVITIANDDLPPDTTPDAFSFAPVIDAPTGSVQTSDAITVSGIDAAAPISVSAGRYSINEQPYTEAPGLVRQGDRIRLQATAADTLATRHDVHLDIGGVTATWSISTSAIDDQPEAVTFREDRHVAPGSVQESNPVIVSGINVPVPVRIVGGSYSIDGGAWMTGVSEVVAGASIRVRQTASAAFGRRTDAVLTIGNVEALYLVSTVAVDKTRDELVFKSVADATRGETVVSEPLLVEHVRPGAPVSIAGVGASYSIDGGPFTDEDGRINPGASVRVRTTLNGASTLAMFYIGDSSGSFTVSSAASDVTPEPFTFAAVTDAAANADITASRVIRGINAAAPISIEGGSYQIGGGAFTTAPGWINEGQRVTVRLRTAATPSASAALRLTIGDISAVFEATTSPYPRPTISLRNGVYDSARTVELEVPGGLPEGTAIYYTLDRSRPTAATGIPYSGPITISETTQLLAAVIRTDGAVVGPVATGTFQIYPVVDDPAPQALPLPADLKFWRVDLPIGRLGRTFGASPPFTATFTSAPFFVRSLDGTLDFFAPVTGMTSLGSDQPRSELREFAADGQEAAWRIGAGARSLAAALTVQQVPSSGRITIGQIHTNDGPVLARLEWQGDQGAPGSLVLFVRAHPDDAPAPSAVLARDLPWGQPVQYRFDVAADGTLTVSGAGRMAVVPISPAWRDRTQYFKAGCYIHDNVGDETEGGAVRFHGIELRSPAVAQRLQRRAAARRVGG